MHTAKTLTTSLAIAAMLSGPALAGTVETQRVTFESEGETLVGTLYLPADRDPGKRLPALVVTGSWTTVKEQMAGTYAREMAERGYAALAFDFRNFGESGGKVRAYESPAMKVVDIANASRFLAGHATVDANRVGGLAICASAGYMAEAINGGAPLKSFASIAGWYHEKQTVEMIYGGAEGVTARIADGEKARQAFAQDGTVTYVKAFDYNDTTAAMSGPFDY